ncbi:MAG: HupE/UreJ family protein [Phycisphaerales bacterium]
MRRLLLAIFFVLCACRVNAHDFGSMRVDVRVQTATACNMIEVEALADLDHVPSGLRSDFPTRLGASSSVVVGAASIPLGQSLEVEAITKGGAPTSQIRIKFRVESTEDASSVAFVTELPLPEYYLVVHTAADSEQTQWVAGHQRSNAVEVGVAAVSEGRLTLLVRYIALGFEHIIPQGFDHILFVLGLCLLGTQFKPLLAQVTAFTIAHSITLALSLTNIFSLPASIVEPLIAASIAYVAIENLFRSNFTRTRIAVVFGFGLVHGMGFAGVLREVGIPADRLWTALLGFNVGVELGQLTVILSAFVLVGVWCRRKEWYRVRVVIPASACIALFALGLTAQRVLWG